MIYFSELRGKKVYTEDGILVGHFEDIIFLASTSAKMTKFVVKDKKKRKLIIPVEYLVKINHKIIIFKSFAISSLKENELFILKNLLDKQIIDLVGKKVVRVNDVALQKKELMGRTNYYIVGVDIGIFGILRWLKIEDLVFDLLRFFRLKVSSNFLSLADIQPLELARGKVVLKKEEEKLEKIRPEDLADYLETTNISNITRILKILDQDLAADVVENLNINYQTALFRKISNKKAVLLISLVDPDEGTDILLSLPKKRRQILLDMLDEKNRKELEKLISLSKTPIGEILTTDYLSISSLATVNDALSLIKKTTMDFSSLNYVYVLNKKKQLVGVINLHELVLNNPNTPIFKIMIQDVIVLHLTTPETIAIKRILRYKLHALPVINKEKQMIGIVSFDDVAEILLEKLGKKN